MNLTDASKKAKQLGSRLRRKAWTDDSEWVEVNPLGVLVRGDVPVAVSMEMLSADDWVVEVRPVTVTHDQYWAAFDVAFEQAVREWSQNYKKSASSISDPKGFARAVCEHMAGQLGLDTEKLKVEDYAALKGLEVIDRYGQLADMMKTYGGLRATAKLSGVTW